MSSSSLIFFVVVVFINLKAVRIFKDQRNKFVLNNPGYGGQNVECLLGSKQKPRGLTEVYLNF